MTQRDSVSLEQFEALLDQHEQLIDAVDTLQDTLAQERVEREALEARVEALHRKLNDAQAFDAPEVAFGDWRDRRVLGALVDGQQYSALELREVYKEQVGLVSVEKIRGRVKRLTSSAYFEQADHGMWTFVGADV